MVTFLSSPFCVFVSIVSHPKPFSPQKDVLTFDWTFWFIRGLFLFFFCKDIYSHLMRYFGVTLEAFLTFFLLFAIFLTVKHIFKHWSLVLTFQKLIEWLKLIAAKIMKCLNYFSPVNNVSHFEMMNSKKNIFFNC